VVQQIKDEHALPVIPSGRSAIAAKSKITSAVSRIGGASPRYEESARNFLAPIALVVLSIGSSCESSP
jgi:hypothetical protein